MIGEVNLADVATTHADDATTHADALACGCA